MELGKRQKQESSTDKFLDLIADPFQAQVGSQILSLRCCAETKGISIGPANFHLRGYYLLIRRIGCTIPRFLLSSTEELACVCAKS